MVVVIGDGGLGAAGEGGSIAIDQMVVADLSPVALFTVLPVDFFALGGEWLAAPPVRVHWHQYRTYGDQRARVLERASDRNLTWQWRHDRL